VKSIVLALGLLAACVTPAGAWNTTYTFVVPVNATHLPLTAYGNAISWTVECWMATGPNFSGDSIGTFKTTISPDASGNFKGNVSVVFPPYPNQPAGGSYQCQLLPFQNGGQISGWYGYTPPPPYSGAFAMGNGNFP